MKVTNKQLTVLKKTISTVALQATSLEIHTKEDMKTAVEVLSVLNKYADSVTDKKELLTKPAYQIIKNAKEMFSPIQNIYETAIESIRSKMSAYQTEQMRIAREEEKKIADRVGEGKGKLKVETAVKKLSEITRPADNVATEEGDVKFREDKKLKIVMASLIPREYLVPDEKKILNDLKEGKTVPGCEIEIVQTVVNYR